MVCCSSPLSPSARRALFTWLLQRGVGHLPAGPDLLEQLFARQHAVAVTQQVDEQVEHLGFDRYGRAAGADPVQRGIDDGVAHLVPVALCLRTVVLPVAASADYIALSPPDDPLSKD